MKKSNESLRKKTYDFTIDVHRHLRYDQNVEVPVSQIDKVLENKMMFDGSSIEGFVRIEESDMYLYPDLSTWMIFPWESAHGKVARLICDIYNPDGTPFAGDPRGNLKRALKDMRDLGFTSFNLGPEPEFFLFKLDEDGGITTTLNDKGGYFDFAPTDLGENCRRDIVLELESLGFEVEASHHEVAPGQHEIDFKYADVVDACDNIQTFKLVVKRLHASMDFTRLSCRNRYLGSMVLVCIAICLCSMMKEMFSMIKTVNWN